MFQNLNPMSKNNEKLIGLLQMAYQSCTTHFKVLRDDDSTPEDELTDLEAEVKELYDQFHAPELWVTTVPYNHSQLVAAILDLKIAPPGNREEVFKYARKLIQHLRKTVLNNAQEWVDNADISEWNLKMLNWLGKLNQALFYARKRLADQGVDLDADPDFPDMQQQFEQDYSLLREQLKDNAVTADQNDIGMVQLFAEFMQEVKDLDHFKGGYRRMNTFIASQLSTPA